MDGHWSMGVDGSYLFEVRSCMNTFNIFSRSLTHLCFFSTLTVQRSPYSVRMFVGLAFFSSQNLEKQVTYFVLVFLYGPHRQNSRQYHAVEDASGHENGMKMEPILHSRQSSTQNSTGRMRAEPSLRVQSLRPRNEKQQILPSPNTSGQLGPS